MNLKGGRGKGWRGARSLAPPVRGYATDKTMPSPALLQYKAQWTLDFQTVKNY